LVIYIDVPTDVLNARLAKRDLDRFEREGAEFFARIAEGFRELQASDPDRWIIIDGTVPKDDVEAAIRTQVNDRLNK
jgi:dTMP kinase